MEKGNTNKAGPRPTRMESMQKAFVTPFCKCRRQVGVFDF